jgi:hypothetical protein
MAKEKRQKTHLERWRSFFDNTMSAITFAEAGEPDEARKFLELKKDSVLLVTDAEGPGERTIRYAVDLCRNTGSALVVVNMGEQDTRQMEENLLKKIGTALDMPLILINLDGPVTEALKALVQSTDKIISVILDQKWMEEKLSGKKYRRWLNNLGCPVVMVEERAT